MIADVGLSSSKPVHTPLELNQKLTSVKFDTHVGTVGDPVLEGFTSYKNLIGKLLYLTITRHDISFAVQNLSQFMQSPKQTHLEAALRIVRYLKGAPELGILLPVASIDTLSIYCDSD